ncbi:MAG: hypothetical protein AB8D78_11290 [Akkermansiaceae bacterium]
MNAWIKKIGFVWLLSAVVSLGNPVSSRMASTFLARGEKALLEIRIEGSEPDRMPEIAPVKDVVVESLGFGPPRMIPGRRLLYSFQYVVSSYAVGKHTIPSIEVTVGGIRSQTKPIQFEVFNPDDLKWSEAESKPLTADGKIRYASIFKVPDKKVYENQTVRSEIKIYVPRDLARTVVDWGVPEFERDGLAVWRYEPSESRGEVNLLGQSYVSLAYTTTMTALKAGDVSIGPATVRLTYVKMVFDRFAQRMEMQSTLDVAKAGFEVSPLPDGAPEGFDNAVGNFTIGTAIKQTDVTEGEPLALDVIVSGRGNLDNLRTPKMIDSKGWKVYDATPEQRGEERRNLEGTVVFSQFVRPLEMKTSVPPFRLVFFDPELEKYQTVTTDSISLNMTPAALGANFESSGPPQALPIPLERMTDILGVVETSKLLRDGRGNFPWWILQILAAVVAFCLIAKALWMRFGHLFERNEEKLKMKKEFQQVLSAKDKDGAGFLRTAATFVERWLTPNESDELHQIIEERDRLCFRASSQSVELPSQRRNQILKAIRRAAFSLMVLMIAGLFVQTSHGQDVSFQAKEAYQSAKYDEAARLWLEAGPYEDLSADTLYNIGNAAYRMGAPGQAALYYRRALVRDGSHEEARQNLRFIERKFGSITVDRPAYQYALAKVSHSTWRAGILTGAWFLVLGLLVFPATRSGSRWRVAGVAGLVSGPLLLSLAGLGYYHYPDDAEFAPVVRQGVIIGEKVVIHTDAARTSPEVIDAPPGSLAEVIQKTGRWAYIGFATKTRGWVPVESIKMIIPEEKPEIPKVRKATADGSSA